MKKIHNEIINGNINLIEQLNYYDINELLEYIKNSENRKDILNKLIPIFIKNNNWHQLHYEIFKLICTEKEFKEYTFYLLHNEHVKIIDFQPTEFKNILEHTTWGIDYILDNLHKCLDDPKIYEMVNFLTEHVITNNKKYYNKLKEIIFGLKDHELIDNFIAISIDSYQELNSNDILSSLYEDPEDYYYQQQTLPFCKKETKMALSQIPTHLKHYIKNNESIKQLLLENFETFLKAEKKEKMSFIESLYNDLPQEIKDKYKDIYQLYKSYPVYFVDKYITDIMNHNGTNFLLKYLKDKEIMYLDTGSTTTAFKIGNEVLKFTRHKHEVNTEKDMFLLAKTLTKNVYDIDKIPILIIEIQKYLGKTHNGKVMTKQDIENFLNELDKQGYEVTDPNCLNRDCCNFGFLGDYKEANIINYNSHEELPEWFKERPIVLYDIDLIYKKDSKIKRKFIR